MMTSKGLYSTTLAFVIGGCFMAGVFEPELRAQGGLPERIAFFRPSGSGKELDPVNTYSRVLQYVRERYYGQLPEERTMTYHAIRGMVNSLDDPYTKFHDPKEFKDMEEENQGEFDGIGATLENIPTEEGFVRVVKPMKGSPAEAAGLRSGDLITRIDGKSVVGLTVDEAVDRIKGRAGTQVRLTVQRKGEKAPRELSIKRAPIESPVVEYEMKEGNVGYISLQHFNAIADQKIDQALRDLERRGARAVVLDLRGNPGGLLNAAVDIASHFVPPQRNVVIVVERGGERDEKQTDARKYDRAALPLVVLVNRSSASASEIVAGAIKDNGVGTIMGTTTFGKGLVQTLIPLEDGSACAITTAKYLTPSGKDINRTREARGGVEPDIAVEVSETQWMQHQDPQLAKALEFLHQKIGYQAPPKQPTAVSAAPAAPGRAPGTPGAKTR